MCVCVVPNEFHTNMLIHFLVGLLKENKEKVNLGFVSLFDF